MDISGWNAKFEIEPGSPEWERLAKVDAEEKRKFMLRKLEEERMRKGITWDELKALVDGDLAEAGLDGSVEIGHLYWFEQTASGPPEVVLMPAPGGKPRLVIEG